MTASNIVTGNTFDKYGTKNPIYRRLMDNFLDRFLGNIDDANPLNILEIGCGEGQLAAVITARKSIDSYSGFDIAPELIEEAERLCPPAEFRLGSAYDLEPYQNRSFDYVIISEVMEHLEEPERALEEISGLDTHQFIFSVPNEPVWRILNVARFKYLRHLGNTPGHLQHWSRRAFGSFLSKRFTVETLVGSFPWTIAVCKNKINAHGSDT